MLGGMIYPDYQEEIGLLSHNGDKKNYIWSAGDPSGCLLVLPCLVIKVNRKLQQPNIGRMKNGTGPSLLQEKGQALLRCFLTVEGIQNGLRRKVIINASRNEDCS